jgi:hypothetical protein
MTHKAEEEWEAMRLENAMQGNNSYKMYYVSMY